jgi:hypothetical protein
VCPPSLVLWESGIDANGSSSSRSNSKKSSNSAEEVLSGDGQRDSSDVCSACNVSLKGGLSSRTKSPDLTYKGDGPGAGTGIGFQPRSHLNPSAHGESDRGTTPCTEREGEGYYGSTINRIEREKFVLYEPEESDDASLCPAHCVQTVTTIIVDEGDMNPLKVRRVSCLSSLYLPSNAFCLLSPFSYLLSPISFLLSPFSCLLSPIS